MVNGHRAKIKGPFGGRGESSPSVAGKPEKAARHPSCWGGPDCTLEAAEGPRDADLATENSFPPK